MVENIEQLIIDAEAAGEPGDFAKGDVIHRGDEEAPVPMLASELKSAGYVYVYDVETREPSLCNRNMLHQVLKQTRNGKRVFTTTKPDLPPMRGTYKCMLHPDGPNREHYDELGLPVCKKSNLTSPYQVTRHMQKRHKAEWATVEAERASAEKEADKMEREADRQLQRELMAQMSGKKQVEPTLGTPEAPLYVSDKPKVGRPKKK